MEEAENAGTAEVRNEDVRKEGGIGEGTSDGETFTEVNNECMNNEGEINEGVMEEPENVGTAEVRNEDAEEDDYLSEEDEDYVAGEGESEYDIDFDIGDDVEEQWDLTHELPKETFAGSNKDGDNEGNGTQVVYEGSSQDESDLHTPVESDDEVVHKRKFPKFKFLEKGDLMRFELGMQFAPKDLIKDVVKDHAMETRTNLWFGSRKMISLGWL